jgi:phage/plasmid primase-like uncharacterized protein
MTYLEIIQWLEDNLAIGLHQDLRGVYELTYIENDGSKCVVQGSTLVSCVIKANQKVHNVSNQ